MTTSDPPSFPSLGERLAQMLEEIPLHDHPSVLDEVERRFRTAGDLEVLREIKAYRAARGEAAAPLEVGAGPRPDAPGFDPDGMQAPQRPDVPRPQDLRAFVKSRGGMIDTGGDLASMGMHELIGRGARAVDPDKMREAAAEAGYLGGDTTRAMRETHPNDLLDALSGDRPVHSVRDEDAAAAWAAHDEARERYDAARGEFGTRSKFGVGRTPRRCRPTPATTSTGRAACTSRRRPTRA